MNLIVWQSKLLALWRERNGYLVLAAGLLLTNLFQLLVVLSFMGRWHTIVVPATFNQGFWLNQSTVSNEYLAQMTEYFATLILDVTPANAAFQEKLLLQYVEPSSYGVLKNQLVANEERLKSQAISTSFYPVDIKTDAKTFTALITGDLKTFVGQEFTSTVRQSYVAHYRYHHGRLLLQQFSEVKQN